ncbi:MerR family transcriptional regulator [Novilysobacter luteus]|uniref:MerR family transcriptional regulator n=1 Tax=Novilysobacter luteus TaxID=2822368 RepID=UPI001BFC3258|nr:MerR family transcriptional regulator [Lysobacter luteus]
MTANSFTISRLAACADVHVETVRYYQRRGLLPEPVRPAGGVRRYGQAEVTRLQFIRRAQAMGFTLQEIAGLLEVKGRLACEQTRQLTERKLADVRLRLAELRQLEGELLELISECSQATAGDCCPTLDLLGHAGDQTKSVPTPRAARRTRVR